MKVNLQKTALLTISDAKSYRPQIFIKDTEDNELVSKEGEVKVLGFIFDQTPTVSAQVNNIIRKNQKALLGATTPEKVWPFR